jgi:mRNA-degrading endonuclease RelE of RelBE toxin-antitoxin system
MASLAETRSSTGSPAHRIAAQLQPPVTPPRAGYILARMRFEIVLAPQAARALRALPARHRAAVRNALETHLRHEPTKVSKRRIKRLRGMVKPQYRLRVGETRVFYDVRDEAVEVIAIVAKRQAQEWLAGEGTPEPNGGAGQGEG